jgi:NAD(P)-dependent dehydrogenase (short-subunit alcohol dehydrogenase family)
MKLANKIALITGGNSGIGFATARLFVAEGARVAITGRNPKTLQAAAKELGDHVLALTADVTDLEATEQRVSQTIPLGRFSEADEVAKAVLYLASDDSAILSGTEIVVDGGATGAPHGAPAFQRSAKQAA